jgi:hypothetical protein
MLQKKDPLPVGRYWIDATNGEHELLFESWLALHNTVALVKSQPLESGLLFEEGTWYLFEVTVPTQWGLADKLGWPTIAEPDVQAKDDTVDKPVVPDATLEDFFGGIQSGATMLLLVLVAGYLLTKNK